MIQKLKGTIYRLTCDRCGATKDAVELPTRCWACRSYQWNGVDKRKLRADSITLDADRDYEAGFDEIFGTGKQAFNADLDTLIRRNRED